MRNRTKFTDKISLLFFLFALVSLFVMVAVRGRGTGKKKKKQVVYVDAFSRFNISGGFCHNGKTNSVFL